MIEELGLFRLSDMRWAVGILFKKGIQRANQRQPCSFSYFFPNGKRTMNCSKLGRHHCAKQSPTSKSPFRPCDSLYSISSPVGSSH